MSTASCAPAKQRRSWARTSVRRVSVAGTPTLMSRRNALNRTRAPASRKTRVKTRSVGTALFFTLPVLVNDRLSDGKGQMQAFQHQDTEQMRSDGEFRGYGGERQSCTSAASRVRPQVRLTKSSTVLTAGLSERRCLKWMMPRTANRVSLPGSPTFIRGGLSPLRNASQLGLHQKPS